ncbi:MAG: S26 family signal peptidase, partial [Desulfobacterales bacterium]|nr:S26 family signal peptidase [Desulfobacterales bacterium]
MWGNLVFIAVDVILVYALLSHYIFFAAVMTGSMTGTVDKGDLIFMTSAGDIEVGDIIMFDAPSVN